MSRRCLLHAGLLGLGALAALLGLSVASAADGFDTATFDDPQFAERYYAPDGQLQRQLIQHAGHRAIPFLTARLHDATDPQRQQELLGLLAACGRQARPALDDYYDQLEVKAVTPSPGPFDLPAAPPPAEPWRATRLRAKTWPQATLADGTRLAAFTGGDLVSPCDIYLAVDADHDGVYEQVLPTGLSDCSGMLPELADTQAILPNQADQAPLELTVSGDILTLGFNRPLFTSVDDYSFWFFHVHPATEQLTLAELRCGETPGLTELTARALLLPWSEAGDADGDGQPDLTDPSPSTPANPKTAVQRMVRRALEFYFPTGNAAQPTATPAPRPATPWHAMYFEPGPGVPSVQFSPEPDTYGIWVDTPQRHEMYKLLLAGATSATRMVLSLTQGDDFSIQPDAPLAGKASAAVWVYQGGCMSTGVALTDLGGESYPLGLLGP